MLVAVAGALGFSYVALSLWDSRVARVVLLSLLAGLLVLNKSFATIAVGPLFIMELGLLLTVVGVAAHPLSRARLAQTPLPYAALGAFLLLGVASLARGWEWGDLALKDSVINFYAAAALLPAAVLASAADARRMLRALLPALLVGSALFVVVQLLSLQGTPRAFSLDMTNSTMTALSASGLVFVLLDPRRWDLPKTTVALFLLGTVLAGLARSVWVGCLLATVLLWAAGRLDRRRLALSAAALAYATAAALSLSAATDARPYRVVEAEVRSFLFHENDASIDNPIGNAEWRLTAWRETLQDRARTNLVLGEGFGRPALEGTSVTRQDDRVQLHNAYLTYLLREGIVGLALFLLLVATAMVRALRVARSASDARHRALALGVAGSIGIYLGNIGFAVVLENPMGGIPFWLLVGLALALPRLVAQPSR